MTAGTTLSMEDKEIVAAQRQMLRALLVKNSRTLQELSFNGSLPEGSIGNIISGKLGASSDVGGWDLDGVGDDAEEPTILDKASSTEMPELTDSNVSERRTIQVAPGVEKILRSAQETWEAIRDGKTTCNSCSGCQGKLHCIEDVELVLCPDCDTTTPVEQEFGGLAFECDEPEESAKCDVGLGVKESHVLQWIKDAA